MRTEIIAEEWEQFCLSCFGDLNDMPQQYIDLRRTFYGGVSALYFLMMQRLERGTDEPTEADLQLMRNIKDELHQFNTDVKEGRA